MAEDAGNDDIEELREQDRFLPIANINRIVKSRLPYNAKVAKESKETIQECVSEFICWITADASDKCQDEKRKTINGEDVVTSMNTLGFSDYIEPLKVFLSKYRASVKEGRKMAATGEDGEAGEEAEDEDGGRREEKAPPSEPMDISFHQGGGDGGGGGAGAGGGGGGYGMGGGF